MAKNNKQENISFTSDVEVKASAEQGKMPSFYIAAYSGDVMNVGGFYNPVIVDLGGLKATRQSIPILYEHDPSQIVGQGDAKIESSGVSVSGSMTATSGVAGTVAEHARNGFKWQASIGASVARREFLEAGKKAIVNGREVTGPLLIAREAVLKEVSFVAIGADDNTSAVVAASFSGVNKMEFNQWLEAKGFKNDALSEDQKNVLKASFDLENKPEEKPAKIEAKAELKSAEQVDHVAIVRLEASRIADINRICASHVDIAAKAIKEGWDAEKAELHVLRASGAKAPAAHIAHNDVSNEVITAALCMGGKLANVEKEFDDKTLEAAHKQFKRGIGLQELLLEAAWANGYTGRNVRSDVEGVLRAAFVRASGFSTIAISGIVGNTANKFLLNGYSAVENTCRLVSATRSVSDFKTITSYRLTGANQFEQVGPAGDLVHGTLGQQSYTNKANTYGKILAITREDIINDDLGALTAVPQMLGRGAALKLNDVFWTAFMDNTSFFTSGTGSYFEGAATNLQVSSLTTAETMFFNQTDADSKPLGIMPKYLLVPNALNVVATSLSRDLELRDTTASTKFTTGNPHAGKFTPVRSSYLSNSSYTGFSTTKWYLLADPSDVPVIEIAFLNGQESPVVETADADFSTLGIQMRGYFDFGVTKQDYRGGVASKGAA
jgi:phage head maturation protease